MGKVTVTEDGTVQPVAVAKVIVTKDGTVQSECHGAEVRFWLDYTDTHVFEAKHVDGRTIAVEFRKVFDGDSDGDWRAVCEQCMSPLDIGDFEIDRVD